MCEGIRPRRACAEMDRNAEVDGTRLKGEKRIHKGPAAKSTSGHDWACWFCALTTATFSSYDSGKSHSHNNICSAEM